MSIEVLAPGALTTIQDLGRPGWAHIGVPRSGAADRQSLRLANRLVGNDDGAAALETTLTGPRLRFLGEATVALTGAPVDARIADRAVQMNEPIAIAAGSELRVGTAKRGLRTYVAFRGGLDVRRVLGSAATDVLTGLGPAPLRRGDSLRVKGWAQSTSECAFGPSAFIELHDVPRLRVMLGPREDWFTRESLERLLGAELTVSSASNRIGVRLEGPPLERAREGELPSEGLVAGCIQVPPGGQPIMLLVDHPTTGGYPVLAVVRGEDLPLAAQLRPGQRLRLDQASAGSISASSRFFG